MKRAFSDKDYSDIIDLPRHVSKKHPHMSIHDRAAQFAPFAALTGYDDAIVQTADSFSAAAEKGGLTYIKEDY